MMDTLDKIKQHAVNAGTSFVKNLKGKYIKPCEGAEYEYVSNDDDYNEFLKSEGAEPKDYVNISDTENTEKEETTSSKTVEKPKMFENISDTIVGKFNQIKNAIDESSEKKTSKKEELVQLQTMVDSMSDDVKNIAESLEILKTITEELETLKINTEAISKETKASAAASSFTLEKTMTDIVELNNKANEINGVVNDLNGKIAASVGEYNIIKNDVDGVKKSIDSMSADVVEINTTQQMLKSSVLSLAANFDALNKKITIGFVTVGIICAACAAMQIVFNIL